MSNKNSAVIERKIRPIYDYLDIGNPKRALQETEKLLKKQHDLLCAKALKVLSLIRLGRINEGKELLCEVESADTDEEYTLQALTYCYRDLGKSENIITLYERALKKQPQNEEFLSHVMMAYARIGEHKKQSQFAMQLYKLKPGKSFYYFWAVMATVMQAYDDKNTRTMYLTLAERMVQKFLKESKITAEAEIKLYCMILEMLGKYDDAVNLLQSDLSTNLIKNNQEKRQNLIELYKKLQKYENIYGICLSALNENPDDWFLWKNLIKSGLELIGKNSETKRTIVDEITQIILKNVHLMDDDAQASTTKPYRAPYLARLRFIVCLLEQELVVRSELGTSPLGEPSRLILDYFRRYGDKPCCFDDMKSFLCLLGEQQHEEFVRELEEICGGLNTSPQCDIRFAQNVTQLNRHLSALQLCRCLGRYKSLTVEEKIILAKETIERYLQGLKFGNELLPTDMQHSDNYLLFAVHTMCEVYVDRGDSSFLIEILLILEYALSKSPSNFHIKVLLAKIYPLIGAAECLVTICETLQLKYVMHETLWYLIADQISPWGFYTNIIQWSSSSISFVAQSDREVVDNVIQCYKSGSFSRIIEFMEFRERLKKSFHNSACNVWRRYFSLIVDCSSVDSIKNGLVSNSYEEEINWSNLFDNRDFRTQKQWEPEDQSEILTQRCKNSLEELVDELKFYHLLTRLFCVFTDDDTSSPTQKTSLANDSNGALTPANATNGSVGRRIGESAAEVADSSNDHTQRRLTVAENFSTILNQLKAHRKHCWDNYRNGVEPPLAIFGPPIGHFDLYLRGGYFDLLTMVFDVAASILKATSTTARKSSDDVVRSESMTDGVDVTPKSTTTDELHVKFPSTVELQASLRVMFAHHQLQEGACLFPHMQICHISFILQTMSMILSMLMLLKNILDPSASTTGGQQKRQKKKKSAQKSNAGSAEMEQNENLILNEFIKFAEIFCQAASTSTRLISDLEMILETDVSLLSLTEPLIIPEVVLNEKKSDFWAKVKSSYDKSLKLLNQLIAQHELAVGQILKSK